MNLRANLMFMIFCLGVVTACATNGGNVLPPPGVDTVLNHEDDVKENPSTYVGRKVMLEGTVKELLSEEAFIVEFGSLFQKDQLLVIEPARDTMQVV
ncbi:MAG: hypothetical protein ACOH5I_23090 [Oligoflexus sp.]